MKQLKKLLLFNFYYFSLYLKLFDIFGFHSFCILKLKKRKIANIGNQVHFLHLNRFVFSFKFKNKRPLKAFFCKKSPVEEVERTEICSGWSGSRCRYDVMFWILKLLFFTFISIKVDSFQILNWLVAGYKKGVAILGS